MSDKSRAKVWSEWRDLVNMAPKEIENWLTTDESKSVGDTGDADSTGRKSGKRIIEIKKTNKDDLSDADWNHMSKVVGYIKRHGAQVPDDPQGSDWAFSMKNWGHDPFAKDGIA